MEFILAFLKLECWGYLGETKSVIYNTFQALTKIPINHWRYIELCLTCLSEVLLIFKFYGTIIKKINYIKDTKNCLDFLASIHIIR